MIPQNEDAMSQPTCGVVIEKQTALIENQSVTVKEVICSRPAVEMVTLVDPDDQSKIMAVVLVCEKHDRDLEHGKSLIVAADNGERIGIEFVVRPKEEKDADNTNGADGPADGG